jgi:hypothetical protein
MAIPTTFNKDGVLDPGTYPASFQDLRASILVVGTGSSATWDQPWRTHLVDRLEILVSQLWSVGIDQIFIDGSFVEDKDHPNDIDGYFDPSLSMDSIADINQFKKLISDLNNLDHHKVWTWEPSSRKPYHGFAKLQLPMWHFYRVELYPHLKQNTGIKDSFGNELQFPSAFRQSRNNFIPKGIVQIIR